MMFRKPSLCDRSHSFSQGNVLDVVHDRLAGDLPVGKTKVVFTVEVKGREHLNEILSELEAKRVRSEKI